MNGANEGWFVIQTSPQGERKAEAELRRAGLRVYLPKRSYEVPNRRKHGAPALRFRPLLIGYLFVRFPPDLRDRWARPQFGIVRDCKGVKGYVRAMGDDGWEPIAVPDRVIAAFMRRQRRREFGRPALLDKRKKLADMRKALKHHAELQVTDGPFAGFMASLERLNDNMQVEAELLIFGRPTLVKLEVGQFEATGKTLELQREAA